MQFFVSQLSLSNFFEKLHNCAIFVTNSNLLLTRGLNILLLPYSRRKDYYDFELKLRPFIYLKETQCPFDPVD